MPDCHIEDIPADRFFGRLRAVEHEESCVPLSGSMDWTSHCNLACTHCYVRPSAPAPDEMNTAQLIYALDTLAAHGVLFLVVTGGEPLVRPDFRELYLHTKALGIIPILFTNATRITPHVADFLAAHPPRKIEITIYGHTEAIYESVTGVPGSFRNFRAGVDALLERGLLVRLKTMVMNRNAHEFEAMKAWAGEKGCDFRYDSIIHGRLDGDPSTLRERIPAEDTARLHFSSPGDKEHFLEYQRSMGDHLPPRHLLFECGAGSMTFHVDASGKMHPCMLWRRDPYDLLTRPPGKSWQEHVAAIRALPPPDGKCASCQDRGICNYCPPVAVIETGHPGEPSSYFCDLARARKRLCHET